MNKKATTIATKMPLASIVDYALIEKLSMKDGLCHRDAKVRAPQAKHLHHRLGPTCLVFSAAKLKGKIVLIDGFTRCESIRQGLTAKPEQVVLLTYTVKSNEELQALFDQIDNPVSAIKARDWVYQGLRKAGKDGKLNSDLMNKGPVPRAASLAVEKDDVREAVQIAYEGIKFVDALNMQPVHTSSGQLAAFIAIALTVKSGQVDAAVATDFILRVNQRTFEKRKGKPQDIAIVNARLMHDTRRFNGAVRGIENARHIRDFTLSSFAYFVELSAATKKAKNQFGLGITEYREWANKLAA